MQHHSPRLSSVDHGTLFVFSLRTTFLNLLSIFIVSYDDEYYGHFLSFGVVIWHILAKKDAIAFGFLPTLFYSFDVHMIIYIDKLRKKMKSLRKNSSASSNEGKSEFNYHFLKRNGMWSSRNYAYGLYRSVLWLLHTVLSYSIYVINVGWWPHFIFFLLLSFLFLSSSISHT
jgi:hypothetical protein